MARGSSAATDLISLSDTKMRRIEPCFHCRPVPRVSDRRIIGGKTFVIRICVQRSVAPAEYGPLKTAYTFMSAICIGARLDATFGFTIPCASRDGTQPDPRDGQTSNAVRFAA